MTRFRVSEASINWSPGHWSLHKEALSETRSGGVEPALGLEQLEYLRATLLQFLILALGDSPGFPCGVL